MISFAHLLGYGLCLVVLVLFIVKYIDHRNEIDDSDEFDEENEEDGSLESLDNIDPITYKVTIYDIYGNLAKELTFEGYLGEIDASPLLGYLSKDKKMHFIYVKENFIVQVDEL